jgi:hypothetical protein
MPRKDILMEDQDTFVITGKPLRPHEYITIKRVVTAADEAWVQNHATTMTGDRRNPQMQLTLGDVRLAMLKRMIVTWGLTKTVKAPDGSETQVAIPCTHQAIENLPVRISDYVHEAINRLNSDEEEESDQDFLPAANEHSETSLEPTSLFPLKG